MVMGYLVLLAFRATLYVVDDVLVHLGPLEIPPN